MSSAGPSRRSGDKTWGLNGACWRQRQAPLAGAGAGPWAGQAAGLCRAGVVRGFHLTFQIEIIHDFTQSHSLYSTLYSADDLRYQLYGED